ncbi:septum formation initiator [Ruminococcus albus SY3]|uniref:Septum formation initiator n=1 Tax=Ruminococcus albus SY3 TaxID=1341156 RepID=A0A011V0W8_RUMAL|nr:septum formation initiator [Ruminococcus albus]EXM39102.1 septum formation initiator [Ruminococcus albus SY3]
MKRDDELDIHDENAENDNDLGDAAELLMAAELNSADETEDDDNEYTESADEYAEDEYTEDVYIENIPETAEDEPLPDDEENIGENVGSKRKRSVFRPVLFAIIVCFCVIAAVDMMSQQNEIEQLRQETVMMTGKIEETKQKNDEYTALLEADEDEFMERVAVEQLGYSYPNERRYYIVNKSE